MQGYSASLPSFVSDSQLASRQKLQLAKLSPGSYETKRTVQVQRLGTLQSTQASQQSNYDDETREDEVEQLLEKLQEANYVASGRRGLKNQNQKQFVFA